MNFIVTSQTVDCCMLVTELSWEEGLQFFTEEYPCRNFKFLTQQICGFYKEPESTTTHCLLSQKWYIQILT